MKRLQYIIWCSLLLFVASCEKDTEPTSFAPAVTTGSAEDLDKTWHRYNPFRRSDSQP